MAGFQFDLSLRLQAGLIKIWVEIDIVWVKIRNIQNLHL